MHRLGLPEIDYIIRDGGYYVMDPKLPVRVDALEFRSLIEKADMEADEEARFQVYKTAFELYKGELLPAISTEIWVTTESLQFKNMFERCTEDVYKRQLFSQEPPLYRNAGGKCAPRRIRDVYKRQVEIMRPNYSNLGKLAMKDFYINGNYQCVKAFAGAILNGTEPPVGYCLL